MNKQDWTHKKLREVAIYLNDGDWIESKDQSTDGIRLLQTGNIGKGVFKDKGEKAKFISPETFDRLQCSEVFSGDVLVSRLPDPIGRSCMIPKLDGRMITAVDCTILRFNSSYNPQLFVYYTGSNNYASHIQQSTTGSTRKRISRKNLANISIPVPSIEEQEAIVAELDEINEVIAEMQQQVADLDALAQSTFYTMFGDPITNEKGWEVIQLGDKCDVTSFKRVLIEDVVNEGIPFIRGTELSALSKLAKGESINFSLFITKEHYERVKAISGVPTVGDLLIPSINSDGNVWILDTDSPMYFKDGRVLWVHLNHEFYTSETLRFIISTLIKNTYAQMASGATFAELKLFILRELKTIMPPLTLQKQFSTQIEAIETAKAELNAQISEMQTLLASRMDYYFD